MPFGLPRNHPRKLREDGILMWLFPVTSYLIQTRGFRLYPLNGSSNSIVGWENIKTRSQLMFVCFISLKCAWKPDPKVYLKIICPNNFDEFGLNFFLVYFLPSCLAWDVPEPNDACPLLDQNNVSMMSQASNAIWSWHILILPSSRTRIPPRFNCWTSVVPAFQSWSYCCVLILFHPSVESWYIYCYFDSLVSRTPSHEPNNLYVYEP